MLRLSVILAVLAAGCSQLSSSNPNSSASASSDEIAAEVLAACATFAAEYIPVADERGLSDFGTKRQLRLLRRLTKENVRLRADAAMRLLAHSECRSENVLFSSMRVATLEGDFRTLIDLQEIVSQKGMLEACPPPGESHHEYDWGNDSDGWRDEWGSDSNGQNDGQHGGSSGHDDEEVAIPGSVLYGAELRVAAAAAIGRILEADRQQAPGEALGHGHGHHNHPNKGNHYGWSNHHTDEGITSEMAAQSVAALELAACPGNAREVRSAAIEALGLARDPASRAFLELLHIEAVEPADDSAANLFLRTMSGRSLTTITGNNHLADSDLDETLSAALDAFNAQGGTP